MLKKHLKTHVLDKDFECPLCHLTFSERANLKRHVRHMHLNERDFVCPIATCEQTFSRKSHLVHHLSGNRHPHEIVQQSCTADLYRIVAEDMQKKRKR